MQLEKAITFFGVVFLLSEIRIQADKAHTANKYKLKRESAKKSSSHSKLCFGCKDQDKRPTYRKLFTPDDRVLQELNIQDIDFTPRDSRESPLSFVRRTMKK